MKLMIFQMAILCIQPNQFCVLLFYFIWICSKNETKIIWIYIWLSNSKVSTTDESTQTARADKSCALKMCETKERRMFCHSRHIPIKSIETKLFFSNFENQKQEEENGANTNEKTLPIEMIYSKQFLLLASPKQISLDRVNLIEYTIHTHDKNHFVSFLCRVFLLFCVLISFSH